jgi:hypothetical protein
MFKKIKNALGLGKGFNHAKGSPSPFAALSRAGLAKVQTISNWASLQGWNYSKRADGRGGYQLEGKLGNKTWRMEQGKPSRDFIKGTELRGRAELDLKDDVIAMIMSRQLKNDLDKRAFALYTDSLQTIANPNLPEEMRWLSIYQEVGWEGLGQAFLNSYAVLTDKRETAMQWLDQAMVDSLLAWPDSDPATPKILMLLRGKAYLRMQYNPDDLPTLEHAIQVFTHACSQAQASFGVDLPL